MSARVLQSAGGGDDPGSTLWEPSAELLIDECMALRKLRAVNSLEPGFYARLN